MARNKETFEQVCEKELGAGFVYTYNDGLIYCELKSDELKEKILAAHKREVAELRECLKEACGLQLRCDSCKIRKCDSICAMKLKWRKALAEAAGEELPVV